MTGNHDIGTETVFTMAVSAMTGIITWRFSIQPDGINRGSNVLRSVNASFGVGHNFIDAGNDDDLFGTET